jgi:hypothetical protein
VSVKKYLRTIEVLVLGTYCGEDSPVVRGQVAQCARVQLHGAVADCMSEVDERERESEVEVESLYMFGEEIVAA